MRTAYHHGSLRRALLQTATELARESGPSAVTVRESARRIGVSPSAAYRHFDDQAALLRAVAEAALLELAGRMRAAISEVPATVDPVASALERFRAVGAAYVRFALASPGLFRTAFASERFVDAECGKEASRDEPLADEPRWVLAEMLDALVDVGVLAAEQRRHAEVAAWSGVHGLVVLILDGALGDAAADPGPLLDATLDMIGLGLCAPALLTTAPAT